MAYSAGTCSASNSEGNAPSSMMFACGGSSLAQIQYLDTACQTLSSVYYETLNSTCSAFYSESYCLLPSSSAYPGVSNNSFTSTIVYAYPAGNEARNYVMLDVYADSSCSSKDFTGNVAFVIGKCFNFQGQYIKITYKGMPGFYQNYIFSNNIYF